jgi:GNAT superfamily N-acetyltransferase
MTIAIRPAILTDAQRIAEIQIACWQTRLNEWAPQWFVDQFKVEQQKSKYADRIHDDEYKIFVATFNGLDVGFAALKPNKSPPLQFKQQIGALYVDPSHEKQGIGSTLLKHLIAFAEENHLGDVVVWTFRDNAASRRLYEACGGELLPDTQSEDMDLDIPHVSYGWRY